MTIITQETNKNSAGQQKTEHPLLVNRIWSAVLFTKTSKMVDTSNGLKFGATTEYPASIVADFGAL